MRPRRRDAAPEVNLTPLLDIVLQLVTFFMMLVHFGTRLEGASMEVRLPVAPAALPGGKPSVDRLVVGLDSKGRLLVGDEAREGFAAEAWWAEEASRRRAGLAALGRPADEIPTLVVIRADRAASYGTVRRAMAEAQARGFANFTLVVLRSRQP
ncbi:MAG: biopolymer transporter ExbD [Isosphaeraceae bacterium]